MVETLEFLIRQAAEQPRHPRGALFRELLRSETFLLSVDAPIGQETATRVSRLDEVLPIWADRDDEQEGAWVPVFPSRDAVAEFVAKGRLQPPKGQEFLWMGYQPGSVFSVLRAVPCFAGIRLYLDRGAVVDVPSSRARELSEGRLPPEAPELYEMPVSRLTLPRGTKLAFTPLAAGPGQPAGRLLRVPDAGHFHADEERKLVRLPLPGAATWMACRHFLQVLRYARRGDCSSGYLEDRLCALMSFQMFGEAEALCEMVLRRGSELFACLGLAAVYARTGRLADCAGL
ncbi:MAG: hypothetical protein KGK30_06700, partial [Elusimicrobia bacterium]|nr:hypothetical protein [Elusimicrobiota bacterium]